MTETEKIEQANETKRILASALVPEPGRSYDPFTEPALYLLARGWECTGDPRTDGGRWFHMEHHNPVEKYERVPVVCEHLEVDRDENGEVRERRIMKQMILKDVNTNRMYLNTQVRVTPAREPLTRQEAVDKQVRIETDAAGRLARMAAEQAAANRAAVQAPRQELDQFALMQRERYK
jgi:hypothetical protein